MAYVKRMDCGWDATVLKGHFSGGAWESEMKVIHLLFFMLKFPIPSKMPDVCNGCKPMPREILALKYKLSYWFTFPNWLNETSGGLSISP